MRSSPGGGCVAVPGVATIGRFERDYGMVQRLGGQSNAEHSQAPPPIPTARSRAANTPPVGNAVTRIAPLVMRRARYGTRRELLQEISAHRVQIDSNTAEFDLERLLDDHPRIARGIPPAVGLGRRRSDIRHPASRIDFRRVGVP